MIYGHLLDFDKRLFVFNKHLFGLLHTNIYLLNEYCLLNLEPSI